MNPLVTIIAPVYNGGEYLTQCIRCVLDQTYTNFELLLIDDGSTDRSGSICDEIAQNDARIRVFHTINKGPGAARNLGIENAKGEYIFFFDSDDMIKPNAIEVLMARQNKVGDGFVIGGFVKQSPSGVVMYETEQTEDMELPHEKFADFFLANSRNPRRSQICLYCWGKMYKTSVLMEHGVRYQENPRRGEDQIFLLDYLNCVPRSYMVAERVCAYIRRPSYGCMSMCLEGDFEEMFVPERQFTVRRNYLYKHFSKEEVDAAVDMQYCYHRILILSRICGQMSLSKFWPTYRYIKNLFHEPTFSARIRRYVPAKENYRLLPFLAKHKLTLPFMLCGLFEAKKFLFKMQRRKQT